MQKNIVILTSSIGNGLYFPALLFKKKLELHSIKVNLYIFEEFLTLKTKQFLKKNKKIAQKDLSFGLDFFNSAFSTIGHGYHKNNISSLLKQFSKVNNLRIICFTNLWIKILHSLYFDYKVKFTVSWCSIDACNPSRWGKLKSDYKNFIKFYYDFFQSNPHKINFLLPIKKEIIPFCDRKKEVIIHGGGWSLGNYQSDIKSLVKYKKNIIIKPNTKINNTKNIYYGEDLNYNFLEKGEFPSFGKFNNKTNSFDYKNCHHYHGIFDIISKSKAIISKPGGMTIMDSVLSETPIVYLDPFGKGEIINIDFIKKLNIGISYQDWEKNNFSEELLNQLHKNILKAKKNSHCIVKKFMTDNDLI